MEGGNWIQIKIEMYHADRSKISNNITYVNVLKFEVSDIIYTDIIYSQSLYLQNGGR